MWWQWIILSIGVALIVIIALFTGGLLRVLRSVESGQGIYIDFAKPILIGGRSRSEEKQNIWVICLRGIAYHIITKKEMRQTVSWLREYYQNGVLCESCGGLIFPHHPVGRVNDQYYHGGQFPCAPPGSDWGVIDANGEPRPTRKSGLTVAEEIQQSGMALMHSFTMPTLDDCEYLLFGVSTSDQYDNFG